MDLERRFFSKVELRADSQGDEMSISGYAARFDKLSERLGNNSFREIIKPGAFKRSLQSDRDIACLLNHDPNFLLGRKKNGSLRVKEDDKGLFFRCSVANTTVGRDTFALIKRGDLDSCSFSFEVDPDGGQDWTEEIDDPETHQRISLRKILRVSALHDCSVVQRPAYPDASVSADDLNSLSRCWPMGLPQSFGAELRSQILGPVRDGRADAARQRVISLMLS